jgi:argininosuccinate synthase
MIRAHAVYEGVYLLGTSIARPLIAKRQIAIAKKFKLMLYHTELQEKEMIK